MKNFKEIAEKCLAGELKGIFKNRKGDSISSEALCRYSSKTYPYSYYYSRWACVTRHGDFFKSGKFSEYDIIDFIPDNMQKKIEIDIPEGKIPVMEQTENGVVITWKDKELTYTELSDKFRNNLNCIHSSLVNLASQAFYKKVKVLRKLTNIRNYFGKPDNMSEGWCIAYSKHYNTFTANYINNADEWFRGVIFKEGEHAEQAIKMLGDELKYLFEPW